MPFDPEQAARQQAEQRAIERESEARAQGARKSPLSSSGGGGFQTGAPKKSPPRPNVEPWKPSPPLTVDDLGGPRDTDAPPRSFGVNQGDQQSYLGHFANDFVLAQGHNVGKKPLGKATDTSKGLVKTGFRKLPGSASGIQGTARYGQPDGEALGLRPPRHVRERRELLNSGPVMAVMGIGPLVLDAPKTRTGTRLSIQHHLDDARRDERHAREHIASRKQHLSAVKQLKKQLKRR